MAFEVVDDGELTFREPEQMVDSYLWEPYLQDLVAATHQRYQFIMGHSYSIGDYGTGSESLVGQDTGEEGNYARTMIASALDDMALLIAVLSNHEDWCDVDEFGEYAGPYTGPTLSFSEIPSYPASPQTFLALMEQMRTVLQALRYKYTVVYGNVEYSVLQTAIESREMHYEYDKPTWWNSLDIGYWHTEDPHPSDTFPVKDSFEAVAMSPLGRAGLWNEIASNLLHPHYGWLCGDDYPIEVMGDPTVRHDNFMITRMCRSGTLIKVKIPPSEHSHFRFVFSLTVLSGWCRNGSVTFNANAGELTEADWNNASLESISATDIFEDSVEVSDADVENPIVALQKEVIIAVPAVTTRYIGFYAENAAVALDPKHVRYLSPGWAPPYLSFYCFDPTGYSGHSPLDETFEAKHYGSTYCWMAAISYEPYTP